MRCVVLEPCSENSKRVKTRVVGLDENDEQFETLVALRTFINQALVDLENDIRRVTFAKAPKRRASDK